MRRTLAVRGSTGSDVVRDWAELESCPFYSSSPTSLDQAAASSLFTIISRCLPRRLQSPRNPRFQSSQCPRSAATSSVDRKCWCWIQGLWSDSDCCCRLGAFGIVFGLPILVYVFVFGCNDVSGCPAPSLLHPSTLSLEQLKREVGWPQEGIAGLFDAQVTLWTLGYYAFSLSLQVFLPGQEAEGVPLACGGRLKYKFNGMARN